MTDTINTNIYIGGNELVFNTTDSKQFIGGGFSVPAIMIKSGIAPIQTLNSHVQIGGDSNKVSNLFEHLALPHWATKYNMNGGEYKEHDNKNDSDTDSDIDDELHDKLLDLVKEHDNKLKTKFKKTKKNTSIDKKNNKTKTKKQKIKTKI